MRVELRLEGALRRRVVRVLNAQRGVRVIPTGDDPGDADLVVGGGGVPIPEDPVGHLLELLSDRFSTQAGAPPLIVARTVEGTPQSAGIAVPFPPPIGPLWSELRDGVHIAPSKSSFVGVMARGEGMSLAVVDDAAFLEALATAGPALAAISGRPELEALQAAGLALAELT